MTLSRSVSRTSFEADSTSKEKKPNMQTTHTVNNNIYICCDIIPD